MITPKNYKQDLDNIANELLAEMNKLKPPSTRDLKENLKGK